MTRIRLLEDDVDNDLLATYLNNHLLGSTAGRDLFRRVARQHTGSEVGQEIRELAREVDADRESLLDIMRRLGVPARASSSLLGSLGEKVGRLKPNGRIIQRSPVSDVIELEGLRAAVAGKAAGWETLLSIADQGTLEGTGQLVQELELLKTRAEDQADRLCRVHLRIAKDTLA
jgi:hypothetical protein